MAASNSRKAKAVGNPQKGIRTGGVPTGGIRTGGDPNSIFSEHPVWSLVNCDVAEDCDWSFHKARLQDEFWDVIFPKLRDFERMTWADILIKEKKKNHNIDPMTLNKAARDRLEALHIEPGAICSLRFGGTLRLYGYLVGPTYCILWYDHDHGNNSSCVCRSNLKHT